MQPMFVSREVTPPAAPVLPPEPLELVVKGHDKPPVGYACATCGMVYLIRTNATEENAAAQKRDAAEHCMRQCICGRKLDYAYRDRCKTCRAEASAAKELKHFNNAAKILASEYADPVYWEGHTGGFGDGYFGIVEEVLEYCESEDIQVPEYVWSCSPSEFYLNAEEIIEQELESQEMYDSAGDNISDAERKRLQTFLDEWVKEQGIKGWMSDFSRAIVIEAPAPTEEQVETADG